MSKTILRKLKVGGGVVFWRLAAFTSQPKLKELLEEIGFGSLSPDRRQMTACLRDAMESSVATTRALIRPLAKKDGFALIEEKRGEQENDYHHLLTAKFENLDADEPYLRITPSYLSEADKIRAAFTEQRDLLKPAQVGGMLARVAQFLGGTALREMGGVYWLPDEKLDSWKRVADAAESAAKDGKTSCYLLRHVMDADAVRAVRDAIVMEIGGESERLHAEIMAGTLGGRALESRRHAAEDLRHKISRYESLLDTGLGEMREKLAKVEEAAAAAIILAAGQDQSGAA